MKHDDCDVSIGGPYDVVGVSNIISVILYVVRPSFPMMTITSSMMMMMSCLVDPVGADVANQSNSGLQHSSTLGAWVCRASNALFLSLRDPVCFCCSCSSMDHTAPQGRSWAQTSQLVTSMLKLVRVFLRVSLKGFFCLPSDRFP